MSMVNHPVGKPGQLLVAGGQALGIKPSWVIRGWYESCRLDDETLPAGGTWNDWVDLAHLILLIEQERALNCDQEPRTAG